MGKNNVPHNTRWSYSQLRHQYGEREALSMLQYMPGLGQFEIDDFVHETCDQVHDECPTFPVTHPWEMEEMTAISMSAQPDHSERWWFGRALRKSTRRR
jgi:hypothetical protein